ncbi:MAG: FtsH protease activity modulator HflK [Zoogloeaceae bacterium]|nr:FtsH protease activity modulator HflK [Zoogloeaceae bacterium]
MIPTLGLLMSANGPQWGHDHRNGGGRRPEQGPPDLEEVWRDLNERLGDLFKNKKSNRRPSDPDDGDDNNDDDNDDGDGGDNHRGGGDRDPREMPPINPAILRRSVMVVLAVLFLTWLASGFYIVDASQRGIVLRFGRLVGETEPGLRWRMPYPIETQEIVNLTGVRTLEIGYRGSDKNKVPKEALMLTDDENIIDIQFSVQYVLKNPGDYLFKSRDPDLAVMQAAETAVREVVGKNRIDFVINEGRAEIADKVSKLMQTILDRYGTGVQISKVNMQNAQPPDQVQAAFEDAVKASQDRERLEYEGRAYANDIIPRARGYKQGVIAAAEGDASRFRQVLTEYVKAPEVTRQRLYLDTMQQIYSNASKIVVDTKGTGNLLYLPLDKLTQTDATGASAASADGGGNAAVSGVSSFSGITPPQRENMSDYNREKSISGSGVNESVRALGRNRGER